MVFSTKYKLLLEQVCCWFCTGKQPDQLKKETKKVSTKIHFELKAHDVRINGNGNMEGYIQKIHEKDTHMAVKF